MPMPGEFSDQSPAHSPFFDCADSAGPNDQQEFPLQHGIERDETGFDQSYLDEVRYWGSQSEDEWFSNGEQLPASEEAAHRTPKDETDIVEPPLEPARHGKSDEPADERDGPTSPHAARGERDAAGSVHEGRRLNGGDGAPRQPEGTRPGTPEPQGAELGYDVITDAQPNTIKGHAQFQYWVLGFGCWVCFCFCLTDMNSQHANRSSARKGGGGRRRDWGSAESFDRLRPQVTMLRLAGALSGGIPGMTEGEAGDTRPIATPGWSTKAEAETHPVNEVHCILVANRVINKQLRYFVKIICYSLNNNNNNPPTPPDLPFIHFCIWKFFRDFFLFLTL